MRRQSWLILLVVWGLLGLSATLMARLQRAQRLGRPGLKVVAEPNFDPRGKVAGDHSIYLPDRVLDFTSQPAPITDLELNWLPRDTTYGRRVYHSTDGMEILLSAVLMGKDRTSIHKPEYCLTGQGWRILRADQDTIRVARPHPYDLPVMKLTTATEVTVHHQMTSLRGLYVYWFVADGELTAEHGQRMWWMARDLLETGVLQRWAYVACFVVCEPGAEARTYERLKRFIADATPRFQLTTGTKADKSPAATRF
ncbi:MAG: EpsI family protein [Verrucomicrobia bacterium]|nr:EpsI family protein [Verrucomicrobiota bacterium]